MSDWDLEDILEKVKEAQMRNKTSPLYTELAKLLVSQAASYSKEPIGGEEKRDVALAFSDHARKINDIDTRLKRLEESNEASQPDVTTRGFMILIEERFKEIEGLICIYSIIVDGVLILTIVVEEGKSIDLLEIVIEKLLDIHKRFPDVKYDFEIEDVDMINQDDYKNQEIIIDCRSGEKTDDYIETAH